MIVNPMCTKVHQFQIQKVNSEVLHISGVERPSNYLHRWRTKTRIADKRHNLQGQRSRSQGNVVRLTSNWPITGE